MVQERPEKSLKTACQARAERYRIKAGQFPAVLSDWYGYAADIYNSSLEVARYMG